MAVPEFKEWAAHDDVLELARQSGALADINAALLAAYSATATAKTRLKPSKIVEDELKLRRWVKTRVRVPEGFKSGESFDGLKTFPLDGGKQLTVAAEVEWTCERIYADLVKFWRAICVEHQADLGIEILRSRDMFEYVVHHVFELARDLFADVPVVFCCLDAPDLQDRFPKIAKEQGV